ncbi:MAG: type II toxin-antitoxin system PemK/MazF family toxin [Leptospiraceae bacterium]|nr:type II toxin-antitoxin system PemK/MazF family toxin [Leptospiraceae bacterium]
MQFDQFDVVKVPFPFTELPIVKRRPALVISRADEFKFNEITPKVVLAMITSSGHKPWPLDVAIQNLSKTGLSSSSLVRMKIFTIDSQLILAKLGKLSAADVKSVQKSLELLLGLKK